MNSSRHKTIRLGQRVAVEVRRVVRFWMYCGAVTRFADRLDVRDREVKNRLKIWGQSNQKDGVGIYCDGKDVYVEQVWGWGRYLRVGFWSCPE